MAASSPKPTPKPARRITVHPLGPNSKPVVLSVIEGGAIIEALDHREAKDFGLAIADAYRALDG